MGIGQHYLTRPETAAALNEGYVRVWPPMRRNMLDLVREEARQILESHRPPALPDGAPGKMQEILAEADRKLAAA